MHQLVLVHGRGQEEFAPNHLKEEWISALMTGAKLAGLSVNRRALQASTSFPYYARILVPHAVQHATGFLSGNKTRKTAQPNSASSKFEESYRKQLIKTLSRDRMKVRESRPQTLGSAFGRRMAQIVDGFFNGAIGNFIKAVLADVHTYLNDAAVRAQVNKLVATEIREAASRGQQVVVVGHSLGSVVALEALHQVKVSLRNIRFVTLGSPLAITAVRSSLEYHLPRQWIWPSSVSSWINASDQRDYVALCSTLDRDEFFKSFNNLRPNKRRRADVYNIIDVKNATDNNHGIAGYLSDPLVARAILS